MTAEPDLMGTHSAIGLAALAATPALSCTTVCLLDKEKTIVAYNYDLRRLRAPRRAERRRAGEETMELF